MDEIFDKYYDKLYYWSLKKTDNKEDAEDLVNNIFVAIFEYFNKNINITKLENLAVELLEE
jgi:DNA-directed RNA polymerase specialized sigma24 family protein